MSRSLQDGLRWTDEGTALCETALASVGDLELAAPSALPGWSRAHLVAHLDGNARALCNLVTWATTGVETPMYSSLDQRNADIASGAVLAPDELRARFLASRAALAHGFANIEDWTAQVRTAQGRTVPASELPWMRAREVMVHAVDLLGGVDVGEIPDDFHLALVADVAAKRSADGSGPSLRLVTSDGAEVAVVEGVGEPVTVTGSPSQLAAYLSGREPSFGPALPAWL
jgi:maleylpyruvate isomerase